MSQHRKTSDGPYYWINKDAADMARLAGGTTGLAIYQALCHLESNAPQNCKGEFFASRSNIAELSGVGVRTVTRYLPILSKTGLFRMTSGRSLEKNRSHEANRFTLLPYGRHGHSPMAPESGLQGQQKRTFSHEVRKNGRAKHEKESGKASGAGASPDGGADADGKPQKKKLPTGINTF